MEAIEKPDKVTVSSDYGASSPCALDFVVSMLEQEHPFLFREESHCHSLFDMSIGSPTAEGSRSRSAGRIPLIISAETVTQSALTGISE